MRVATAGVPQAAASVSVIPQPSRADVLASDPRPAVEVDELVVVEAPGKADPALGVELVDLRLELVAPVALADDHRLEAGMARLQRDERVDEQVEALHRHEPADARRRAASGDFSPPGVNRGSMPGRHDVHAVGLEAAGRRRARAFDDSDSVTIGVRR